MHILTPLIAVASTALKCDYDDEAVAVRLHRGEWTVKSFLLWLVQALGVAITLCSALAGLLATAFWYHITAQTYCENVSGPLYRNVSLLGLFSLGSGVLVFLATQQLIDLIAHAYTTWESVSPSVAQQARFNALFETTRQLTIAINELKADKQIINRRFQRLEARVYELEEENRRLLQGNESESGCSSFSA